MPLDPQAVFDAAMRLPEGDRLTLASQLLESLPPEDTTMALDDSELAAELDRRFSTSDAGIPWAELKAEG
ncbi:MAG: hypothetical protein U1E05_16695 [Patescibacteria group bacterium]|nr:hypothetical protein [Patescibacteria group bacterium]